MASTTGRRVVEYLTNKSGGAVAAGDVVVIDTSNNEAFTTSTAGGFLGMIGVAQEAIANNAAGRVCTSGQVDLVNVPSSVTRGNYGKTHTVAKQAADAGSSRGSGVFCQFTTGGTTPKAHLFGIADGSTASGGISAGTSFPGSPSTHDLYYRTDRDILYFYDGTRWLSVDRHQISFAPSADVNAALTSSQPYAISGVPYLGVYSLWLERIDMGAQHVSGTVDGSNYWDLKLNYYTNVGGRVAIAGGNTQAIASVGNNTVGVSIGAVLNAGAVNLELQCVKQGTPPNLYAWGGTLQYRLVG